MDEEQSDSNNSKLDDEIKEKKSIDIDDSKKVFDEVAQQNGTHEPPLNAMIPQHGKQ